MNSVNSVRILINKRYINEREFDILENSELIKEIKYIDFKKINKYHYNIYKVIEINNIEHIIYYKP